MGHRYCELYEMSKVKFEIRISESETILKKKLNREMIEIRKAPVKFRFVIEFVFRNSGFVFSDSTIQRSEAFAGVLDKRTAHCGRNKL